MSQQLPPTRDPENLEVLPEAQVPDHLAWHLDSLHQRRMRQLQRRVRSPFNVPAWSIILMLFIVMLAAGAVAFAVYSLRDDEPTSAFAPVISVTTAPDLIESTDADSIAWSDGTPSDGVQIIIAAQTPASLQIDGPVLPTVVITLTPIPLTVGASVEVAGVGNQELNIRNVPSLIDSTILFRAPDGTAFEVIDGPQQADGFTWWRIRDVEFRVEGWAVANYLQVTQ